VNFVSCLQEVTDELTGTEKTVVAVITKEVAGASKSGQQQQMQQHMQLPSPTGASAKLQARVAGEKRKS
jgi:hypothetical protein